jgi:ComF family protein
LDACRSLLAYEDEGRELLARLKYRNARSSIWWLAAGMAALVSAAWPAPDVVTWAPTTPARRRARGYDQAELLARGVARQLGVPCRRILQRANGPPQTGRSKEERVRGPAFDVRGRMPVQGALVVLVDDVVTTGATLTAAALALRAAGARSVVAVTAGRTPRRR